MIGAGKSTLLKYTLVCDIADITKLARPFSKRAISLGSIAATGSSPKPRFSPVLPKVIPLPRYDFASQRPIGELRCASSF